LETLKKKKDFDKVFNDGDSRASRYFVLYWKPNTREQNRYGFSINKRVGKAVVRNKLRRRLKEIIRNRLNTGHLGFYDIVIIARKPVISLDFHEIQDELHRLFKRTGLIEK